MPDLEPDRAAAIVEDEPIRPHFGPEDAGRLVSADEFAAATYAEPWVYERVDGRLEVLSPEGKDHVRSSTPWLLRLAAFALGRPDIVQAVVPSPWVRIDADTERIGDIGVYLGGLLDDLNLPDQVPDIIFEFVSPSKEDRRRDYIRKRADYLKAGIREYVIVDRFDRRVTVLTLGEAGYVERVLGLGDVYESPLLPGFALPLTAAWWPK